MTTVIVLTNDASCTPNISEIIEEANIALDNIKADIEERKDEFQNITFWNLRHPTAKIGWPFISRRYITVGEWADKKGIERHSNNFDSVYTELQSKKLFGYTYLYDAVAKAYSSDRYNFEENVGIYKEVRRVANITGHPESLHIPTNVYNFILRWSP